MTPSLGLEVLFSPRSIALIGASQDASSISGQPLANLRDHGYRGQIHPVNPRYDEIDGLKCYPSIMAVPKRPDLALIAIGAKHVPGVLRECGQRGVPFALIISAGFAETGEDGARLQREIVDIARQHAIGVVGPNCQGMMNVTEGMFAGFGAAFRIPRITPGPVSLVTQSGGFGYSVVSLAEEAGVGFRHVVCTGNEAGISTLDFIEFFIADASTRIAAGYVEGLADARRLLDIGDMALAAGKPILIWKVGSSEAGRRAAISHTANLGGANELYKAAFQQRGILQVNDVQDLADITRVVLHGREPCNRRVGIVTISGGAGVVMADVCSELGLIIPRLSTESERRLAQVLPAFGSSRNPVDITGNIFNEPDLLREVLRIVGDDESVDVLIVMMLLLQGELAVRFASEIVEFNRTFDKPLLLCWSAREVLARDAFALVDAASIPRYSTPMRAGRALHAITRFAEARRRYAERKCTPVVAVAARTKHALLQDRSSKLTEHDAKQVLADYGISVTRERLARSRGDAVSIAAQIGFPVVLKVNSADISHKTECRGVRVGLVDAKQVADAYEEIVMNARSFDSMARIDGVLVQEMVGGGTETIVGITNDMRFGPALMFGLGGIFAEVLQDFSFRICPVDSDEALEMVRQVRGYAALAGARGRERADIAAIVDTLVKLSALAIDAKDCLAELDINPLFVLPEGGGVKAADALIRLLPSHPLDERMALGQAAGAG